MLIANSSIRFHTYKDRLEASDLIKKRLVTRDRYVTTRTRQLSYRFTPHFHPYVSELVNDLIRGSIRGLQAADTKYVRHGDGTYEIQPGTTEVELKTKVTAKLNEDETREVLAGTRFLLPDDTLVTLPGGSQTKSPGKMFVSDERGLRLVIAGGTADVKFGSGFSLVNETSITLPEGTPVKLPAGSELILRSCKPKPERYKPLFVKGDAYDPSDLVRLPYPAKDLDFTPSGAYSVYNWELFYHIPLTVAIHLSKNQRFEEAQQWFHHIFDPTDDSDGPTPERFWKVKPFQFTDAKLIQEILTNLSTNADPVLRQGTFNSIQAWKDAPFRPHVIARYRHTAYMLKAVMAYLDNLIDWGDALFRQDTIETINEATQIYVMAANLLGPRPQPVPKKGSVRPQTYANFRKDLDAFGNALKDLESDLPFDLAPLPDGTTEEDARLSTVASVGQSLYFCIPRNDKLLAYWDTVADRLFKIHNSLNILGIFRQLPLFEPPIDPALLARATAAGLDVGAIVNGLNQPLPLVRFMFLVQKAAEICQEVKSLGNNLLAAIEKEDNEALAVLRAKHERVILGMAEVVRYSQWQEAIKAREGLEKSFVNAAQRYTYYERQLGKQESEIKIPELDGLDTAGLERMKFKADEPAVSERTIDVDISGDLGNSGGKIISGHEAEELNKLETARGFQIAASSLEALGGVLAIIPQFDAKAAPMGCGAEVGFGGQHLHSLASSLAAVSRTIGDQYSYEANKASKIGSYARREQDWAFQSNLAAGEITQIFKQLRAAQIREAIAEREWKNHQQQIKHSEEIERFLTEEKNGKQTNQAFYTWMKREVKGLYGQCFQFAFDVAKKAERALQHELGNRELSYLQFGYLAGKQGLLAGEKLHLDLKRMEMAYHELNAREYEITRHVSLLQLNPAALLQLRATGRCSLSLPEELFDLDGPGHYFRRIKTVALSLPCVTGPYTGVNCTLTLLKSSIRMQSVAGGDGYARTGSEDSRFDDYFGSLQSIVTSTGQNDSGMFETNLRDERYLPFEGAGVVSEWQLQLPANPSQADPTNPSEADPQQFDYDTISDVILHLRYTAREGGNLLRAGAMKNLTTRINDSQASGSTRLFSLRHEFPSEWAKLKGAKNVNPANPFELSLELRPEHYPFWSKGRLQTTKRVDLFAKANVAMNVAYKTDNDENPVALDARMGNLRIAKLKDDKPLPAPVGIHKFTFSNNSLEDFWLTLTWGK